MDDLGHRCNAFVRTYFHCEIKQTKILLRIASSRNLIYFWIALTQVLENNGVKMRNQSVGKPLKAASTTKTKLWSIIHWCFWRLYVLTILILRIRQSNDWSLLICTSTGIQCYIIVLCIVAQKGSDLRECMHGLYIVAWPHHHQAYPWIRAPTHQLHHRHLT